MADVRGRLSQVERGFVEFLRIVALGIGSAVVYGILHDQITVRVCVEYFTIGHPPVFDTTSPTLLALGWGVIATWWVGLPLGVCVAMAARLGTRPKISALQLLKPVGVLLLAMGAVSLIAGVVGYFVAKAGGVILLEPLSLAVPRERHVVFLADLWAHDAAYASAFVGGMALCYRVLRRRRALRQNS